MRNLLVHECWLNRRDCYRIDTGKFKQIGWASPTFLNTFGKLMSLLDVSDGEQAIYDGVQGGDGAAGVAAGCIQGAGGSGHGP